MYKCGVVYSGRALTANKFQYYISVLIRILLEFTSLTH